MIDREKLEKDTIAGGNGSNYSFTGLLLNYRKQCLDPTLRKERRLSGAVHLCRLATVFVAALVSGALFFSVRNCLRAHHHTPTSQINRNRGGTL